MCDGGFMYSYKPNVNNVNQLLSLDRPLTLLSIRVCTSCFDL